MEPQVMQSSGHAEIQVSANQQRPEFHVQSMATCYLCAISCSTLRCISMQAMTLQMLVLETLLNT